MPNPQEEHFAIQTLKFPFRLAFRSLDQILGKLILAILPNLPVARQFYEIRSGNADQNVSQLSIRWKK